MEVLYHIRPYFDIPLYSPFIGLIYGRCLQVRKLKLTLNISYIYIIDYSYRYTGIYQDLTRRSLELRHGFCHCPKVPLADWIERRIGGEIELQEAIH